MDCNDIPKEVMRKFKSGATEVEDCGPQWNGNAKILERQGGKTCAKYQRKNIPDRCLKEEY